MKKKLSNNSTIKAFKIYELVLKKNFQLDPKSDQITKPQNFKKFLLVGLRTFSCLL